MIETKNDMTMHYYLRDHEGNVRVVTDGGWAGGVAGGFAGAKIGAVVGAWAGGFGAIPGAIIGGAIGGFAGAKGGSYWSGSLVDYFYNMGE